MEMKLYNTEYIKEVENLIEQDKAILIGSRGFNVHDETSDYDVSIRLKDLPDNLKEIIYNKDCNIKKYFNKLPLGNAWFIPKYNNVDWIIFEDDKDFAVIRLVMDEIKLLPSHYLRNKNIRVSLFETGLTNYGFIDADINEDPIPIPY